MSYMRNRSVLRVELKDLEGASYHKAYQFFKEKLGKADEIDINGNEVKYFCYENSEFIPITDGNKWGVQIVLAEGDEHDGYEDLLINWRELNRQVKRLTRRFKVMKNQCIIASYQWYNGVNEPIEFLEYKKGKKDENQVG